MVSSEGEEVKNFLLMAALTSILSCSLVLPDRPETKVTKRSSHITKIRNCVDDFMSDHGVKVDEAFDICSKIYRR